ncbi:hypothetical protein IAQ61_002062 [Plenodomus lingam]|uniref:uncharacterized protein n=1 Tax=Leptosphaeria maculans TaxID=5022 RepID=UPI00332D00F2|nr:hypothetical protein IAQ61_002062 [Plenodomus lingam]
MLFVVVCYSRGYGHYSLESLQDFDVRQFPFHGWTLPRKACPMYSLAVNTVMLDAVSMDRLEGPTTWHRNATSTETPASSAFDQAMKVSLATKGVDTGNCYLN